MLNSREEISFFSQLIPVLLILCYLISPRAFVDVSKHTLGKTLAVLFICLYAFQDVIHGMFLCILVILYYQQVLESFISRSGENYVEFIPKPSEKNGDCEFEEYVESDFTSVREAYPEKLPPLKKMREVLYLKEKRHNPHVKCKNSVKNNVISQVYPEKECSSKIQIQVINKQDIESSLESKNSHNA